jgi:hypothetical protein
MSYPKKVYEFVDRVAVNPNGPLLREPLPKGKPWQFLSRGQVIASTGRYRRHFVGTIDEEVTIAVTFEIGATKYTFEAQCDLIYCSKCGKYYNDPPGCPKHGGFH